MPPPVHVREVIKTLGYADSPSFLGRNRSVLESTRSFGHIFRTAKKKLSLQGVYTLNPDPGNTSENIVPVVYVCRAKSSEEADKIHRLVWNQDVVPFLIIVTPSGVRLYSGFQYQTAKGATDESTAQPLANFARLADLCTDFSANAIDTGAIWRKRAKDIAPEQRVNWQLLDNLRNLDLLLRNKTGLDKEVSHALIGKYVYLHYLRDRGILSEKKLARWGCSVDEVFGANARRDTVAKVVDHLDGWLNGSVFPLNFRSRKAPLQQHIRLVAGVFSGDEVSELGNVQLSLDFKAYDFSFIPIETLSIVYEQFLHSPSKPKADGGDATTTGREQGAYYTPIPVVNFMLSEVNERKPLTKKTRVLDPSCGSGAFLVQCYRQLIEQRLAKNGRLNPKELRDVLQSQIFGIDADGDACNVTELSLILTLLDYVDPPDLEDRYRNFKLPTLRNQNVFQANFFSPKAAWVEPFKKQPFDWIVGNPPWKRLNPNKLKEHEPEVWKWIAANEKTKPVGGNQAARAFAWKVCDFLNPDGEVAFFLPAMTLFENPAAGFRRKFFRQMKVASVANFSNLAEVLSGRRFRVPSAAFFYQPRQGESAGINPDEFVRVYSPLVANQESTRPTQSRERTESWNLVVNASEIRDIPTVSVANGDGLPWKLATWGSQLDLRLLERLEQKFPSLRDCENEDVFVVSQGLELRSDGRIGEDVELVEEVVGKKRLVTDRLKRFRNIFRFPNQSLEDLDTSYRFLRIRGGRLPLVVCRPPHVIVSAARNYSVYSNEYFVVPPRQIGIVSPNDDHDLLKALSLYLSSDFAFYHQFLTSTEFGVKRDRATLAALRNIPVPLTQLSRAELRDWSWLQHELSSTRPRAIDELRKANGAVGKQMDFPEIGQADDGQAELLEVLNAKVAQLLGMEQRESALVHDLIRVRLELNDGKVGKNATRTPTLAEVRKYASRLKSELDAFIGDLMSKRHQVHIVHDNLSGMIRVDLLKDTSASRKIVVSAADREEVQQLERTRSKLRKEKSQWVYFDRNLRIYEGTRTYVLKPMQRFQWTESQAMIDAREIIAETLAG